MPAGAPLMVVDGAGVVIRWSHQAEQLLGRGADEVVGRPATRLVTRASAGAGHDAAPDHGEVVLRDADGHPVDADLRVRPLLGRDDSLVWGVFRAPADEIAPPGTGTTVLEALSVHTPVGLHVLDKELRIMPADMAVEAMRSAAPERIQGRRLTDVYGLSVPAEVEAMLRGVLESGADAPERTVRVRQGDDPRAEYFVGVSAFPLRAPRGEVLGVAVAVVDVTEREKRRARLRVIETVRNRVGRTLDVVAISQELVNVLVPGFADVAVVEVVDSVVRGEDPPVGPLGREVPLRRAAFRHSGGDEQNQAHPVYDVRSLPFRTPYAQALADLKPRLVTLLPDTPWLAADPDRAEAIRRSGARSLLAVPLTLRGAVLGLVSLYRTGQAPLFDEKDLALALEFVAHTALCIDNARCYTREHTIAATLQRQLLPPYDSSQIGLQTAHLHVPGAEGGGGWFDTFALSSARTALVIGDVAGNGIHAATTMGQLRTVIRSLAALDLEPDELLARLNDTATRLAQERVALPPGDPLHQQALRASCAYAIYDPLARTCTIARAGHPPPVIAHPDGTTEIPDLPSGDPLGAAEGLPFATTTLTLAEGSRIAFYTGSLLLAPGEPAPLRQVLTGVDRSLQDVCDETVYRLPGNTRPGDAILLLARTRTFPADRVATWHLDRDPAAAAAARAHARQQLTTWGVDDETAQATELIVSELVTNAVRYGTPPLRLRLILDRTLTCEVHDTSASAPRLRHARTVDEGGRGLFIVAQLARNWGSRSTSDGKIIWTEQALPPEHPQAGVPAHLDRVE